MYEMDEQTGTTHIQAANVNNHIQAVSVFRQAIQFYLKGEAHLLPYKRKTVICPASSLLWFNAM